MTQRVYRVQKGERGSWSIVRVIPGWITPVAGPYTSKKFALQVARTLAGDGGKVIEA